MTAVYRILAAMFVAAVFSSSGLAPAQTHQDPQQFIWLAIKEQLTGPDGEEYFKSTLKGSVVPFLKGVLIAGIFNGGMSKLILGLTDSKTPEVTLILHNGDVKVTGEPNTQIEFQGVPIEFTKTPFMLAFDVSINDIKGLKTERPASKKATSKN